MVLAAVSADEADRGVMRSLDREQARAAVRLMRVPGVGAAMFRRLVERYHTPTAALAAVEAGAARKEGFPVPRATVKRSVATLLEKAIAWINSLPPHHHVLWLGHTKYPNRLAQVGEPPPVLFCRGRLTALRLPTLAIVGAREAGTVGLELTRQIAAWAASQQICVVSGGARGIDAAAHRACLEQGGQTIAVIATGVDVAYPREHADLFAEISRAGCVLSEFFPGTPPVASHFPTRNRIIAGLAQAVVFIEGNARSGGLITVRKGLQAERPVWAARRPGLLEGAIPELERCLPAERFFHEVDSLFPALQACCVVER